MTRICTWSGSGTLMWRMTGIKRERKWLFQCSHRLSSFPSPSRCEKSLTVTAKELYTSPPVPPPILSFSSLTIWCWSSGIGFSALSAFCLCSFTFISQAGSSHDDALGVITLPLCLFSVLHLSDSPILSPFPSCIPVVIEQQRSVRKHIYTMHNYNPSILLTWLL